MLGPVQASHQGRPLPMVRGRPLEVLAILVWRHPHPVPNDQLAEWLWEGRPPPTARTAVHVHVSKLRQALGPGVVATGHTGYHLELGDDGIDAVRYETAVRSAQCRLPGEAATALDELEAAAVWWRGQPYLEVVDREWIQPELARLDELRLGAEELRHDAALRLGRHRSLVDELWRSAEKSPLRELRWEQLMLALYRGGRQADALRAYQRARQVLSDQLGLAPGPDLRELERRILVHDPRLDEDLRRAVHRGNITRRPEPLIGRHDQLVDIRDLMEASRVVTLVGPAGIGKSRVAVEVAAAVERDHTHGSWFVDLSGAIRPGLVAQVVAGVFGLSGSPEHGPLDPLELLRIDLRDRELLLVLDGCETVAAEVAALVEVLAAAAPGLRVLATSRVPLGVPGEAVRVLGSLGVPVPGEGEVDWLRCPSVELFVARRGSGWPGQVELAAIADLCRQLEGVPLAIELAAAMARGVATTDLADDLPGRLTGGDSSPAVEALRATIEWSLDLLADEDRLVLRHLAVFATGFTLGSARAVAADAPRADRVTGAVARLVHASLISIDAARTPARYFLPDAVRQYARQELDAHGQTDLVRHRLVAYLVGVAMSLRPDHVGPGHYEVFSQLEAEHDNARAVLADLLSQDETGTALGLAIALHEFWVERGFWAEGVSWLVRTLEAYGDEPVLLRARGLMALTRTASSFTAIAAHHDELVEAEAIVAGSPDAEAVDRYAASLFLGIATAVRGDAEQARAHLDRSLAASQALPTSVQQEWAAALLGAYSSLSRLLEGDLVGARQGVHTAARRFESLGDLGVAGRVLMYAGTVAQMGGDIDGARDDMRRSVERCSAAGLRATAAHAQLTLGVIAAQCGDPDADRTLQRARDTLDAVGDIRCRAVAERTRGAVCGQAGDRDAALTRFRACLGDLAATDHRALAVGVAEVALIYAAGGRGADAASLARAATVWAQGRGLPLSPMESARIDAARALLEAPDALAPSSGEPEDRPDLTELLRLAGA